MILPPRRSDFNSANSLTGLMVTGVKDRTTGQLANNSNIATLVDILLRANIGENVWIKKQTVLVFQKVKQ